MPWTHCDAELNDTEASCPVCGTTKAEWTVGFDSTRTFQVARRTLFRIELVDANDEPVGSQPFELKRLSDGDWEPGTLDEDGFAKVPSPREARGLVRFTGLATGSIRRTSPERDDASPSLKSGSEGDAVFELQEILVELGYPLVVDGAFGSETDGAVRWFQGDRALGVDGKVGPNTWAALRAADPPAPPLPPPPVLRRGDRGAKVRKLQQGLKAQGAAVEVDGQFGPATEEALRAFQERKGLDVDGKVGPNTWASVLSEGTPATLACSTGRKHTYELSGVRPAPSGTFQLELYDLLLPSEAVVVAEGLASEARMPVADHYQEAYRRYVFPFPDPEPGAGCRATLEVDGERYVLFDEVDLVSYVEALASSEPETPFLVRWPDLPDEDPAPAGDDPVDDGDADGSGEEWPGDFGPADDDLDEGTDPAPIYEFDPGSHEFGEN